MLQKKAKGFKRNGVLNPFQRAKKWVNNPIKCQRRFIGVFCNRFKKNLSLDKKVLKEKPEGRRNGLTTPLNALEAVYLSCLKKMYEKNKKNGLITLRGYFATTLYDMARMSKIPLYNQKQVIDKLKMRGIIKYDPLLFDKYDEGSDPMVLFKILC